MCPAASPTGKYIVCLLQRAEHPYVIFIPILWMTFFLVGKQQMSQIGYLAIGSHRPHAQHRHSERKLLPMSARFLMQTCTDVMDSSGRLTRDKVTSLLARQSRPHCQYLNDKQGLSTWQCLPSDHIIFLHGILGLRRVHQTIHTWLCFSFAYTGLLWNSKPTTSNC